MASFFTGCEIDLVARWRMTWVRNYDCGIGVGTRVVGRL